MPIPPLEASEASTQEVASVKPVAPEARKVERFVFVDALRGLAALWVVLFHACYGKHIELLISKLPRWATAFLESGELGVPIFFVLSGFVITYSVSRYRVDLPFIGRFIVRRSIRLDPPYWASIVLVIAFAYLSRLVMPSRSYTPPGGGQVLAHLFYLEQILGFTQFNPVYWTLAYEIQFYLVFCLLMGLAHATRRDESDRRSLFVIFVPALLIAALWPLGIYTGEIWPGLFPPFWHGFLLGMLACWVMNGTIHPAWFIVYAVTLGLGGFWNGNWFSMTCVATSVLLVIASRTNGLGRWLDWRWLQFLGLISYSLYLTHNPITGALFNVGYRITGRSLAAEIFWFVAMIGVSVAAAAAFWWLLERPSLALARRLRLRQK